MLNVLHYIQRRYEHYAFSSASARPEFTASFDALYRLRSVSTAANDLAFSPSALNHVLGRLRAALDDALFIRQGNQMQPTAKAESLAAGITHALAGLSACLTRDDTFVPQTS